MHLHSFPSIYNFGHAALNELLSAEVIVEEKVDGSQFSFGVDPGDGELYFRSKGVQFPLGKVEGMFSRGVDAIYEIKNQLSPGWTYRGEYLQKPKHNGLAYNRVPERHVILFDINREQEETYLTREEKEAEAARVGLEIVPVLYRGKIQGADHFRSLLDTESVLGGQKVEGVVIKPANYDVFGRDKKCVMAKYVSEAFREIQAREWKVTNPNKADVIQFLGEQFKTPARWEKAVYHLRDRGLIENSPRDIGPLIKEIPDDILKEEAEFIKQRLFDWAWPQIKRIATSGFPEWYKDRLVSAQFSSLDEMETKVES